MVPISVQQLILSLLQSAVGTSISTIQLTPVGGGSINQCFQLATNSGQHYFVKINRLAKLPGLFLLEKEGLNMIASLGIIRTPVVVAQGEADVYQVLILEWIGQGVKSPAFWQRFGEQLAMLHSMPVVSNTPIGTGMFGLDKDNYMGSLVQENGPLEDWAGFFMQRRLRPQLQLAMDQGLIGREVVSRFERLYQRLPAIFGPVTGPALVHGDLWSGNFLCDEAAQPVLIDPAVYYGHPCVDLAMTTLFGGFELGFYDSYHHILPPMPNFRERWAIANLYPLLIHLNLFGKGYLPDILQTIDRY